MEAATGTDIDFETNQYKLIPHGLIGRFDLDAPFDSPPNRIDGCETFVEVKTLADLSMTLKRTRESKRSIRCRKTSSCPCFEVSLPYLHSKALVLWQGRQIFGLGCRPFRKPLTTSWFCSTFSDVCVPIEHSAAKISTQSMY